MLVAGTALQALGAAGMMVVALSLAGSVRAMGVVTASLAVFGAVAPLVGTAVSAALSWQAAMVLPVLSLLAVPAVLRRAGGPAGTAAGPVDAIGAALLVAVVTALVFVPQRPREAGVVAVVAAALLVWHVRRRPDGFVPRAVAASGRFAGAAGLGIGLAVVNFGILYAVPGLLTAQTGWAAGELGVALLVPYLVGGAVSSVLVAASARLGFRPLAGVLAATALAAVAFAMLGGSMVALLFVAMVAGSLAAATGQGALGYRAVASVPERVRPTAMGLFTLCYLLGAAFGPAVAALASAP